MSHSKTSENKPERSMDARTAMFAGEAKIWIASNRLSAPDRPLSPGRPSPLRRLLKATVRSMTLYLDLQPGAHFVVGQTFTDMRADAGPGLGARCRPAFVYSLAVLLADS